jgi:hypothetical protein
VIKNKMDMHANSFYVNLIVIYLVTAFLKW